MSRKISILKVLLPCTLYNSYEFKFQATHSPKRVFFKEIPYNPLFTKLYFKMIFIVLMALVITPYCRGLGHAWIGSYGNLTLWKPII